MIKKVKKTKSNVELVEPPSGIITLDGELEVDLNRGVIYFNRKDTGSSVLRIQGLDRAALKQKLAAPNVEIIDIALGEL